MILLSRNKVREWIAIKLEKAASTGSAPATGAPTKTAGAKRKAGSKAGTAKTRRKRASVAATALTDNLTVMLVVALLGWAVHGVDLGREEGGGTLCVCVCVCVCV
jgi:hypothetical protein